MTHPFESPGTAANRSTRVFIDYSLDPLEMNKHKRSSPKGGRVELPETGVEPARPYGHKHLKLARLPIPPPGRLLPNESTYPRMGVNLAPGFAKPSRYVWLFCQT